MNKSNYTYRLSFILLAVVIWEALFWSLSGIILFLIGYLDPSSTGEQVSFKYPDQFWLLVLLLPALAAYFYSVLKINRLSEQASPNIQKYILQPVSTFNSFLRFFFFRNALVFLIFAIAQPVFGKKKVAGTMESLELVICLDVSNSMNTKDISPTISRLEIAKRAMNEMVNKLHGEKMGIAVFAGGAFVQLPLTGDYAAAKMFISEIETNMISNQGTNIGEALTVSSEMFSKAKTTKGIILVTDGENHEGLPEEALKKIKERQIEVSILGIGTTQGGPVPKDPNRPELGNKTTASGRMVISRVDPAFIRSIATKTGGSATLSSDEFPDLSELLTQINQMKRSKVKDLEFEVHENRYQIPLFVSLLFWSLFLIWNSLPKHTIKH